MYQQRIYCTLLIHWKEVEFLHRQPNNSKILIRLAKYLALYKKRFFLICFFILVSTVTIFVQPLIIRSITDEGMYDRDFHQILIYSLMLFISYVVWQMVEYIQANMFAELYNKFSFNLYSEAFIKLLNMPLKYFQENNNTEISERLSSDINSISEITSNSFIMSITYVLRIISGIIGLSIISWKLTIIILFFIPIKFILVTRLSKIKSKMFKTIMENTSRFSSWFGDNLGGIREIKLWNLYESITKEFVLRRQDIMKNYKKDIMVDKLYSSSETILEIAITCLLYIASGYYICTQGFSIGNAFAFLAYTSNVIIPISMVLNVKYLLAHIIPSAKRYFEFIDLSTEEDTFGSNKSFINSNKSGFIVFDKVNFSYNNNSHVIMKNLNLKINKGEKIGIIGLNGSGKTTLINLLLGFYKVDNGEIYIDGHPINEMRLNELREYFAVVSQDPYLFQDTIKRNIDMFQNCDNATIISAAKKSGAFEFIEKYPLNIMHEIGRNGSNLSGGEKQKLAVARAFIKNAKIVILDEATSNYDIYSQKYLRNIIRNEFWDKTVILITHKYDDLEIMDRVYRLERNALTEIRDGELWDYASSNN